MRIEFNLKHAKTGEEKVWVYPNDEDCRIDHWFLPDDKEPSKAIVNFEELQRDDPTLALLNRLPREKGTLKRFLDWWFNDAGVDERKSFKITATLAQWTPLTTLCGRALKATITRDWASI